MINRRSFVFVAGAAALVGAGVLSSAADPAKRDSVKVVVDGVLGTILRPYNNPKLVTATVIAAGGEFVIDASGNKNAQRELVRLADKYIPRGSSIIVSPQLTVTGRLEYRPTKIADDKGQTVDGPKMWVLVADSITES